MRNCGCQCPARGIATATLKVITKHQYLLSGEGFELEGQTGKPLQKEGVSLLVTAINAEPGARFTLTRLTRLKAITDMQKLLPFRSEAEIRACST